MQFWSLRGSTPYAEAKALQLKLVELRAADRIPDTFLFLEHDPVVTRGRGLQQTREREGLRHMPLPALPPGISFSETERGGDLTYHGPGQLVMYPICKLDGRGFGADHDVTGFLRSLEGVLIATLREWGIEGQAREEATGVWVGERKVASIGIAVRKWVTYHGIALNCVNDLKPFHLISPCGFSPEVMTRVSDLRPELGWQGSSLWRTEAERALAREIGGEYARVESYDGVGIPRFSAPETRL
jgi:lipoyl(octanoyl) transferase